jgi:hypothetical protein
MEKRLIGFDPETNAKLKELSSLYDLSVSWLVRKAVTEWLNVYKAPSITPQPIALTPSKEA